MTYLRYDQHIARALPRMITVVQAMHPPKIEAWAVALVPWSTRMALSCVSFRTSPSEREISPLDIPEEKKLVKRERISYVAI
jgi:hypothetical protein